MTATPSLPPWSRWGPTVQGTFSIALIVATWPLWWGGSGGVTEFPAIPWLGVLVAVPSIVDRVLTVLLLTASLGLLPTTEWFRPGRRWAIGVYLASLTGLLLLDQHRFQPWAWLFWLQGIALWGLAADSAERWTRGIVISLYVWSAVSKIDVTFLSERGPWLLTGLLDGLGLDAGLIAKQRLARLSWLLPIGELAAAVLLAFRGTRSSGLVLAGLMHLSLLVTLGPWGHNHHAGVLLWNLFFLVQNPLLFWPGPFAPSSPEAERPAIPALSRGILLVAIAVPALESWDWYDHWPAWAVYSDRPEIVRGWIPEAAVLQLPSELRSGPEPLSDLCEIRLDPWSFTTRRCPVYPQARYRLALLRTLVHRVSPVPEVRVVVESTPDRRIGKRESIELRGVEELDLACDRYWINTRARQ